MGGKVGEGGEAGEKWEENGGRRETKIKNTKKKKTYTVHSTL